MYRTELVDRKWITVVSRYLVFYSCGILLQAVPVEGQEQMAVRDLEFRTIREDLGSLADGGKAGRYIDDGEGRLKANVDGRGLAIAILATGVSDSSQALAGKVLSGLDVLEPGNNGIGDRNGFGTAMASIAVGYSDDYTGGVAPGARIVPVRVVDEHGSAGENSILSGLARLLESAPQIENDTGAKISVVLLPLSGPALPTAQFQEFRALFDRLEDQGIVICVPTGNLDGNDRDHSARVFPSEFSKVISVGAISDADLSKVRTELKAYGKSLKEVRRGEIAPFSRWRPNDGNELPATTIFAPGVGIPSIGQDDKLIVLSGTGPAAAAVSGAIVLVQQKCRDLLWDLRNSKGKSAQSFQALNEKWLPPVDIVTECLQIGGYNTVTKADDQEFEFRSLNVAGALEAVEQRYADDLASFINGTGTSILGFTPANP